MTSSPVTSHNLSNLSPSWGYLIDLPFNKKIDPSPFACSFFSVHPGYHRAQASNTFQIKSSNISNANATNLSPNSYGIRQPNSVFELNLGLVVLVSGIGAMTVFRFANVELI